jgi:hypothetical protein
VKGTVPTFTPKLAVGVYSNFPGDKGVQKAGEPLAQQSYKSVSDNLNNMLSNNNLLNEKERESQERDEQERREKEFQERMERERKRKEEQEKKEQEKKEHEEKQKKDLSLDSSLSRLTLSAKENKTTGKKENENENVTLSLQTIPNVVFKEKNKEEKDTPSSNSDLAKALSKLSSAVDEDKMFSETKEKETEKEKETLCVVCNKSIEDDKYLSINNEPFHKSCLVCANCGKEMKEYFVFYIIIIIIFLFFIIFF